MPTTRQPSALMPTDVLQTSVVEDAPGDRPGQVAKLPPMSDADLQLRIQQLITKGSAGVHSGRLMQQCIDETVAAAVALFTDAR